MALLLAAALLVLGITGQGCGTAAKDAGPDAAGSDPVEADTGPEATIYFPATSGRLEPEIRPAPPDLDRAQRCLWLAEQLVAGPETSGLRPALPAETTVASVFAAPDGTVYLDFAVPGETVAMGSTDELLAVYSVVNTLLRDDPSSDGVVILINGRQRGTLAGHVDTSRPLRERPELIREAG